MNSVPAAPTNWSAIPANWTVTDGNITGIRCDKAAGDNVAWYQCAERLGHSRASCFGDKINGTTVCACSAFSGWDGTCIEARCAYGAATGCAAQNPNFYLNAVLCSANMLVVTFTLVYALSTIWKGRAMCSRSITNTTLGWVSLAAFCLWMWFGAVFLSNVVLQSDEPMVRNQEEGAGYERILEGIGGIVGRAMDGLLLVCSLHRFSHLFACPPPYQVVFQKPFCIPGYIICNTIAYLSFPLMYV